jgi:hypothetical protein
MFSFVRQPEDKSTKQHTRALDETEHIKMAERENRFEEMLKMTERSDSSFSVYKPDSIPTKEITSHASPGDTAPGQGYSFAHRRGESLQGYANPNRSPVASTSSLGESTRVEGDSALVEGETPRSPPLRFKGMLTADAIARALARRQRQSEARHLPFPPDHLTPLNSHPTDSTRITTVFHGSLCEIAFRRKPTI